MKSKRRSLDCALLLHLDDGEKTAEIMDTKSDLTPEEKAQIVFLHGPVFRQRRLRV